MSEEIQKAEKVIDPIAERKKAEIKAGFLNPFGEKTTYAEFQEAIKTSKLSLEEYCKGKLEKEQIEFLEAELSIINKK